MRALPGSASRTSSVDSASQLTRETAAEAQRRRIRRATAELVAKRGYTGVRIELIVKRARVSFKTFYKHYAGKEAAFIDVFERASAATEHRVRAALEDSEEEWPDRVAVALTAFFEAIIDEPLIARACLVEGPTAARRSSSTTRKLRRPSSRSSARGANTTPRQGLCR